MAIKSKELAEMLEVSTATMSLVLNHKPGISEELRKTLLSQIREMGYGYMIKDEETGAEDGNARKKMVYLVYANPQDASEESAFYPPVLEGAEREARKAGYQLSILHMDGRRGKGVIELKKEGYAGIIVQSAVLDGELIAELDKTEIPYVTIDSYEAGKNVSTVVSNNEQGIYQAVRYLKSLGHRSIGYVRSGSESMCFARRHRFFQYAMAEEADVVWNPDYDINVHGWGKEAQNEIDAFLAAGKGIPDAFILETDVLAVPLYQSLSQAGYSIPEDISVIGFDGRAVCSILSPPLTTMRVHRNFMGRAVVMLLCHKIENKERGLDEIAAKLELDVELVCMGSVANRMARKAEP